MQGGRRVLCRSVEATVARVCSVRSVRKATEAFKENSP